MKTIEYLLAHNTPLQVTMALGLFLLTLLLLILVRNFLTARLRALSERTIAIWDDVLTEVVASTKLPFMASLSLLVGCTQIDLPEAISKLPYRAMVVLLILQSGIWVTRAMQTTMQKRMATSQSEASAAGHFSVITFIARLAIWIVVLLLLLDNLGVNITTLVASLGIGGIAVALALQNILGDLFASLSIAIDKPFLVGDFIIVGDFMGTVKDVGLKTTRVQSLSGEELIFSNNDLLQSRIRNYKRMAERRVVFGFGVTYDTPPEKLEALAAKVRSIIEAMEGVRFDRAHFKGFGASSLDFEAVYYLLSPDFNLYMDAQQHINLELLRYCLQQEVSFALPTQTVHVASMVAPPGGWPDAKVVETNSQLAGPSDQG